MGFIHPWHLRREGKRTATILQPDMLRQSLLPNPVLHPSPAEPRCVHAMSTGLPMNGGADLGHYILGQLLINYNSVVCRRTAA